jgi:beta-lactamase regulating signal transducer with metallopeptidase domain
MNFAAIASWYITGNILIAIGFAIAVLTSTVLSIVKKPLSYRSELRFHYALITILLASVMVGPMLPKREIFQPVAKIWSAPSKSVVASQDSNMVNGGGYVSLPSQTPNFIQLGLVNRLSLFAIALAFLVGTLRLLRDIRRLRVIRTQAFLVRKFSTVKIYVSDNIRVPFSYWLPSQRNVVIPEKLIGSPNFKSAVLHELQHHRQGDTQWVYLLWVIRLTFLMNPFAFMWSRWVSEIQEFACDETLVGQGKVESLAYASCLVQVAKTALNSEPQPVCATGLMFLVDRNTLKRRIKAMINAKKTNTSFGRIIPILGLSAALLGATAFAAQGLVQDRRITLDQAQELSKAASNGDGFPVVVNDLVLKWLNYYVGTPDGREKVKLALARMENYRSIIKGKLSEYQMPQELLAVPFTESGFQNLSPEQNKVSGAAGIWQFVSGTALNYGLRVDGQVDERLNVEVETDAAMRYLLANKLRFKDWGLSILSYNAGEKAVQTAIDKTGSRDAWTLVRSGFSGLSAEENSNYLPKLMAAIIITKNPTLIQ